MSEDEMNLQCAFAMQKLVYLRSTFITQYGGGKLRLVQDRCSGMSEPYEPSRNDEQVMELWKHFKLWEAVLDGSLVLGDNFHLAVVQFISERQKAHTAATVLSSSIVVTATVDRETT